MDWEKWYHIFNIFAPFITMIGIVISFWVSLKSLKEVRQEKVLAQKPYLIFGQGGFSDKVIFVKARRTSYGYNPEVMQIAKRDIPEDAISVRREF